MRNRSLRRENAKEEWREIKKSKKGKKISFTEFWRKKYVKV